MIQGELTNSCKRRETPWCSLIRRKKESLSLPTKKLKNENYQRCDMIKPKIKYNNIKKEDSNVSFEQGLRDNICKYINDDDRNDIDKI